MNIVAKKKKLVRVKKMIKKKKKEIDNQEKVLRDQAKAWEKSVPSHKVIQKEEKFENKIEKILLSEQPSRLLL